jgi:capsular exopolysaccharide synthesis family protein
MDLSEHFRTIWRRRRRVVLVSLVIAAVAFVWSRSQPPVYRGDSLLSVTPGRAPGDTNVEQNTLFLTRTYAELATTRPVLTEAALRSGLPISVATAARRVSAKASSEVGFIRLSATGPSAAEATRLAGVGAETLVDAVRARQAQTLGETLAPVEAELSQVEQALNSSPPESAGRLALQARYEALLRSATESRLRPTDEVVVVAPARSESQPVTPRPVRDALLALLAALVVNAELTVLLGALADRFSSQGHDTEIAEVTGLPVLARIPSGGGDDVVEAFRALRTNLVFMETTERMRTVAVVSVDPGAGKSFTSVNLARSATNLGIPVVLVDGDLRRPSIHRHLGLAVEPGLSDLLRGADLQAVMRVAPDDDLLHVLTSGSPVTDPAGVVGGRQFAEVLQRLDWAGMVVVDTPAGALFADGLAIASQCDATIIVVDAHATRRQAARSLTRQLRQLGANPIGVVLNRSEAPTRAAYYYRSEAPADA